MNKVEIGHNLYKDGKYEEALEYYTQALSMAKTRPQRIALHSNRAACFLKLHHFHLAAEECTAVLELDRNHTGALMLRAQTLVTLKEYQCALFDVNRLMELNPSSEVYQNLQTRLKTQLSLAPIPEDEAEELEEDDEEEEVKEDEKEELNKAAEGENEDGKYTVLETRGNQYDKSNKTISMAELDCKILDEGTQVEKSKYISQSQTLKETPEPRKEIPRPKGHSRLDYSRWDKVEDDSSDDDEDDDDEDSQPQYRFRVRTVGVRPVK